MGLFCILPHRGYGVIFSLKKSSDTSPNPSSHARMFFKF
nr:MAG TPA: hypothetical protein [Caudoviricetes sp.]